MTGRRSSSAVNIGSGGGDASGVSRAWVEENYLSKNFFNQLFTIHGTRTYTDEDTQEQVTEEVVITPNSIADGEEYKLSNIEVSIGLWTQQFLSALGLNSGGGGGGGVSSLADLLDVALSSPSNGQALVYDSASGKWVNKTLFTGMSYSNSILSVTIGGVTKTATIQSGSASLDWDSITNKPDTATRWPSFSEVNNKPTTLSGYGITDAKFGTESSGYIPITLGRTTKNVLLPSALQDYATKLWVEGKDNAIKTWVEEKGYITSSALNGYATQQWVQQQGYITSSAIIDMATQTWVNNWFVKDSGGSLGSADKIYNIGCKRVFSGYDMPDAPVDGWVSGIALGSNWNDNHYQHYLVESGDRWYTTREYSNGSMSGWKTFAYLTDNVASATKLQTARTIWGQSFNGTENVNGTFYFTNGDATMKIYGTTSTQSSFGNERVAIQTSFDEQDPLTSSYPSTYPDRSALLLQPRGGYVGIGTTTPAFKLDVNGDVRVSNIYQTGNYSLMNQQGVGLMVEGSAVTGTEYHATFGFHPAGSLSWLNNNLVMQLKTNTATGENWVHINNGILQIGDARLVYDSTNNALKAVKADGTALNFYATGGVSALGMSAGVSQINAMTFNHLSVKNRLILSGNVNIVTGTASYMTRNANDYDCIYLMNTYTQSKINNKQYYYNQYDNVGLHGTTYNYDDSWFIDPDGCARFSRVYLHSNTYIHTNGSDLLLTIGSTTYKLTKTTA